MLYRSSSKAESKIFALNRFVKKFSKNTSKVGFGRVCNYIIIPGWGGILGDDVAARSRNTQHLGGGVGLHRDWG